MVLSLAAAALLALILTELLYIRVVTQTACREIRTLELINRE